MTKPIEYMMERQLRENIKTMEIQHYQSISSDFRGPFQTSVPVFSNMFELLWSSAGVKVTSCLWALNYYGLAWETEKKKKKISQFHMNLFFRPSC